MNLRAEQIELVRGVDAAFESGARTVLMQGATGFGKTHTAAALIRRRVDQGGRVVFAAHLDAIVDDTSDRLNAAGVAHGIVQAGRAAFPLARIQVASLATLHRRGDRPPADLVIVDECHRAMAASVRAVVQGYPHARILGLTATPERGDGQPLGDVFERIVCGPTVKFLTAAGLLAPAIVYSPPSPSPGVLAMDPIEALDRYAPGVASMIFASSAEHARQLTARLGSRAALILGDTPRDERRATRARVKKGEPLVLVGCGVFVEGWDSPEVRAVVLARGFSFVGSYLQACGRALRVTLGKTHATIIDLTGAATTHGLPEDDREWTLNGVRRTGAGLAPIVRCGECLAVFHPAATCPRCGASMGKRDAVKRRATRIERQELARLDTRTEAERDAIALKGITKRLISSGRFPDHVIATMAQNIIDRKKAKRVSKGIVDE